MTPCSSAAGSIDSVAASTPRSNSGSLPPGRGRHASSYLRSLNRSPRTGSGNGNRRRRRTMARTCTLVPEYQLAPPKQPGLLNTQRRQLRRCQTGPAGDSVDVRGEKPLKQSLQGPQPNSLRQVHHSTCHHEEQLCTEKPVCSLREAPSQNPGISEPSTLRQASPEVDVRPTTMENRSVHCGPATDSNDSSGQLTSVTAGGCCTGPRSHVMGADSNLVQRVLVPDISLRPRSHPMPTYICFQTSRAEVPKVAYIFLPAVPSTGSQQSTMADVALDQDAAQTTGIRDVAAEQLCVTGILDWLTSGCGARGVASCSRRRGKYGLPVPFLCLS